MKKALLPSAWEIRLAAGSLGRMATKIQQNPKLQHSSGNFKSENLMLKSFASRPTLATRRGPCATQPWKTERRTCLLARAQGPVGVAKG